MTDRVTKFSDDDIETLFYLVAVTQLPDVSDAKLEVQQNLSTQVSEILNRRIRGGGISEDELSKVLQLAKREMEIKVLQVKLEGDEEQLFGHRPRLEEATGGANGNTQT